MNNRKMVVNKFGNVYGEQFTGMSFAGNVFDITGISPALRTMQGGWQSTHDYRNKTNRVY